MPRKRNEPKPGKIVFKGDPKATQDVFEMLADMLFAYEKKQLDKRKTAG